MRQVVKFLIVDGHGTARVVTKRPFYSPGEAVFRLTINIPEPRLIAGDITLELPELEMPAPVIEYTEVPREDVDA